VSAAAADLLKSILPGTYAQVFPKSPVQVVGAGESRHPGNLSDGHGRGGEQIFYALEAQAQKLLVESTLEFLAKGLLQWAAGEVRCRNHIVHTQQRL
jgi:hypothetical protein